MHHIYPTSEYPSDLIRLSEACRILPPRRGKRTNLSALARRGRRGEFKLYIVNGLYMASRAEIVALGRPKRVVATRLDRQVARILAAPDIP